MTTNVDEATGIQAVLPFVRQRNARPLPVLEPPESLFRFPAADDPDPGTVRLLTMSVYAALLGLAGLGVGARGLVSSIGGGVPGWYVPALAIGGMLSVVLSVGAFLSIHRPALPWILFLAAAVPLGSAVLLAVAY
jgi:hypothetical protein